MNKIWSTACLAALLALVSASAAPAQDGKAIFKQEDKLTDQDPKDTVVKNSYAKVFKVKLEAGKTYRIDMTSREMDSILRIEDDKGKQLAFDDDGGGFPNARIIFKSDEDAEYRIIATNIVEPNSQLKATGAFTLNIVPATPLDVLTMRVQSIAKASPAERTATLNEFTKHLQGLGNKLGMGEMQLAMATASGLERAAPKQAVTAYQDFAKIFAAAGDPKIAEAGRRLEGCARRLTLVGNNMEVKGTTLDGKEIDLAKMKGKVVLVDFWATWCGPCIAEIPNMTKMYDAYKDRGFEILAVSVDQTKEAPTKFVEARKLPWPCIHDSRAEGTSLSDYYGVMFIPLPILVDREGKVVSLSARGQELEKLLEKHIGPQQEEKK